MSISAPRELDQRRAVRYMFRLFDEYYSLLRCKSVVSYRNCVIVAHLAGCNMKQIVQCPFSLLFNFNNCSFPFIIEFAWIGNMRLSNKVEVSFGATKHHSGSNERPEWCFVS